ncbi:MAG TPA: NAD(P)H-hydrate dehydratase [Planctomycetota bacterium]|nr:NAD(P)H-hydrate dehydratase [Planctomycetota bacterium]
MPGLPPRRPETHKGDYGTVLVVAGSPGMTGAAYLAAEAAYRAGAGLVVLACPERVADILSIKHTCGIVRPFPPRAAARRVLAEAARSTAAVIGPGLSRDPAAVRLVRELVARLEIPFVLDADGLNAFEGRAELLARARAPRILTPHPGEAARLLGRTAGDVQADREGTARELARRLGGIAVLKGHGTLVTDGRRLFRNRTGNPGMATGGSGDVLAGVLGALLGQKIEPFEAACLGVEVHGRAGDLGARDLGEVSLMATDLLAYLPRAFLGKERKSSGRGIP